MSIHSELQNLKKNRSGDKPFSIHGKSGDVENGNGYFELLADKAPTALEIVTENDERNERKRFLIAYFTALKTWLNKFEFEFVKDLYAVGRDEKEIFERLGLNGRKVKRNISEKISEHREELAELIDNSEWEGAELFSRCFLTSPAQITQDKKTVDQEPRGIKGFGNFLKAKETRSYRKGYQAGWQKCLYSTRVASISVSIGKINETIDFLNCTVSEKAIESSLKIFDIEITEELRLFLSLIIGAGRVAIKSLEDIKSVLAHKGNERRSRNAPQDVYTADRKDV